MATRNASKVAKIKKREEVFRATGPAPGTISTVRIGAKKDGTITLDGKDITLKGSGKINIEASSDVTIKGSKINQN